MGLGFQALIWQLKCPVLALSPVRVNIKCLCVCVAVRVFLEKIFISNFIGRLRFGWWLPSPPPLPVRRKISLRFGGGFAFGFGLSRWFMGSGVSGFAFSSVCFPYSVCLLGHNLLGHYNIILYWL